MNLLTKTDGEFVFLIGKEIKEYNSYDDVPVDEIREVVKFLPDIPPDPHTLQQHEEIHAWNEEFKNLMRKVYASRNSYR